MEYGWSFLKIFSVVLLVIVLGVAGCAVGPYYNVWNQGMEGEAELSRAEQNRKIAVLEATAARDSATLNAEAEVIRAEGVAKANAIVAEGLGGPEGYLRYLWIDKLGENGQDVIYIPTEAGMPILEAGKRATPKYEPAPTIDAGQ